MSASVSQSGSGPAHEEVLTLAEAALYLRAPEAEVARLAAEGEVPARKIGGEWRFLRKALDDWLRYPGRPYHQVGMIHPDWVLHSPFAEELFLMLEERLLRRLKQAAPPFRKPGSKKTVLEHFGVFQD